MNKEISKRNIKVADGDEKNHQAFFMELSRLEKAKKSCVEQNNCDEFNKLGGDTRLNTIKPHVKRQQDINRREKETRKDAGENNQFQTSQNGTEVGIAKVTKSADHSGKSKNNEIMSNQKVLDTKRTNKIATNKQAMSEDISKEIEEIRYLIEYMNNKKQKL